MSFSCWPAAFGNSLGTKNRGYRPQTEAGYVCEYFNAGKEEPYAWVEYEKGNSLTQSTAGAFDEVYAEKLVKTDSTGGWNYFNEGPGLKWMSDYGRRKAE